MTFFPVFIPFHPLSIWIGLGENGLRHSTVYSNLTSWDETIRISTLCPFTRRILRLEFFISFLEWFRVMGALVTGDPP
jgi:hypothetical protein